MVTEHLYLSFPHEPEGILAKLRAAVVNAQSLATVARTLDLGHEVLLGRGEATTGGRDKASILADTLEAVIGAVFLQNGIASAGRFVHTLFDPVVEEAATLGAGLDWKTSLQELSATLSLGVPNYQVTESGPDHDKRFVAYAVVSDERYGPGHGLNKKQAEQEAAASAFAALKTLWDSQQTAVVGGIGA